MIRGQAGPPFRRQEGGEARQKGQDLRALVASRGAPCRGLRGARHPAGNRLEFHLAVR